MKDMVAFDFFLAPRVLLHLSFAFMILSHDRLDGPSILRSLNIRQLNGPLGSCWKHPPWDSGPRNVLTLEVRYANPSRKTLSMDGYMAGNQFRDERNQFPLGRSLVLDAKVSHKVGGGVGLFTAAENLLNGTRRQPRPCHNSVCRSPAFRRAL
jgi:hypothetical protein